MITSSMVAEILKDLEESLNKKMAEPHSPTVVFPTVRRVLAQTAAMDLVSVQPMTYSAPTLNYFDFKYITVSLYKIFYVNTLGEDMTVEIVANSLEDAIEKIEDLDYVKFHIDYGPPEAQAAE